MARTFLALVTTLLITLSGCTASPADPPAEQEVAPEPATSLDEDLPEEVDTDPGPWPDGERHTWIDATFTWHPIRDPAPDPTTLLDLTMDVFRATGGLVLQTVAAGCNRNPDYTSTDELYLNDRALFPPVPAGTDRIEVTLSWTLQDSPIDSLVVFLGSPEGNGTESPHLANGETFSLPVDETGWEDGSRATQWDLWICPAASMEQREGVQEYFGRTFLGDVHVLMEFVNDD